MFDGNTISSNGMSTEYGDLYDVMGRGATPGAHFSTWNKSVLQWIPAGAITTVTISGVYRVFRFDHANASLSNTLALKVPRDGTRDYWIGYRRGIINNGLNDGAYIQWGYHQNQ